MVLLVEQIDGARRQHQPVRNVVAGGREKIGQDDRLARFNLLSDQNGTWGSRLLLDPWCDLASNEDAGGHRRKFQTKVEREGFAGLQRDVLSAPEKRRLRNNDAIAARS